MRSLFIMGIASALLTVSAGASEVELESPAESEPATNAAPSDGDAAGALGYVARATFTTGVVDREPQDQVQNLSNEHVEVAYFSEVRDMAGGTLTHRWKHGDEVVAEVSFEISGPRWRTHSTKSLDPARLGEWSVETVDAGGTVIRTDRFTYSETAQAVAESPGAEALPAADEIRIDGEAGVSPPASPDPSEEMP